MRASTLLISTLTIGVVSTARPVAAQADSAKVVAVVEGFHAALAAGDSTAALALLADDVTILESGGIETRAAYRSGHLKADIDFAKAVPSKHTLSRVTVVGDAAWVSGTSVTEGEFRGRTVNSAGAELVVLAKVNGRWLIKAVHWSSRQRRPS